jgi:hypothetical protein
LAVQEVFHNAEKHLQELQAVSRVVVEELGVAAII